MASLCLSLTQMTIPQKEDDLSLSLSLAIPLQHSQLAMSPTKAGFKDDLSDACLLCTCQCSFLFSLSLSVCLSPRAHSLSLALWLSPRRGGLGVRPLRDPHVSSLWLSLVLSSPPPPPSSLPPSLYRGALAARMSRAEEQQATEEPLCPRRLFVVSMMIFIKWAFVLD